MRLCFFARWFRSQNNFLLAAKAMPKAVFVGQTRITNLNSQALYVRKVSR